MDQVTNITIPLFLGMIVFFFLAEIGIHRTSLKRLRWVLFALYVYLNLSETLLFRKVSPSMRFELQLFWSYRLALAGNMMMLSEILLNILLYVPFGFLLSDLRYLGSLKIILLGFACSTLTELTQLVFHLGLFEFDDIFDNTLGCILGVLFFLFLRFLTQKMQDGKSRPAKGHEY